MSQIREKLSPSQGKKMHAVAEAQSIMRAIPRDHDEPKGAWLRRAGHFFGLTPAQAKKIEYSEVKDLRASRLDAMRERLGELKERAAKREETLNAIHTRIAEARSDHGSRNPDGGRGGIAPAGGRGDGTSSGSVREDRPAAAAVRPAQR